ncbi:MAG: HpcH/HpaI aldolase/citrate lyase family protein, partial [Bryobacteraceae bacterium]
MSDELNARSLLFTPATRPERYERAVASGADIVAIDLEDSVVGAEKELARKTALPWFATPRTGKATRALRINSLRTEYWRGDIEAIRSSEAKPDILLIPKVESPDDLSVVESSLGDSGAKIRFIALVESIRGVERGEEIARKGPRLAALFFGAVDLSAELRCTNSWDALLYARSKVIFAAAGTGLDVLDVPWLALDDAAGLEAEIAAAVRMGFTGKAAIHPRHIAAIHAAFTPS